MLFSVVLLANLSFFEVLKGFGILFETDKQRGAVYMRTEEHVKVNRTFYESYTNKRIDC